tara:strand:+ start:288 stop:1112 length:825 start_codon:yes stop_codon:yes gene_type:complete
MGISKTYKIIDCFTFYNEIDLLNLRLSELYDYVDYFVISESLHTHRGKSKKLYLEENMDLFSQFKDKIINVCDKTKYNSSDYSWKIENNQRNEIAKGLSSLDLDDNDQILISDLDEIPNIETLKKVIPVEWVFTLEMDFYYFTLYNKIKKNWKKSKILNYKTFVEKFNSSPQYVRDSVDYRKILNFRFDRNVIKDGGWHFSYFGDVDFIQNKIRNFAHFEFDNEKYFNAKNILNSINNGVDLYGDKNIKINQLKQLDLDKLPKNVGLIINQINT